MLYPLIIIIIRQENRLETNYERGPEQERANERESAPCEMLYLYVREPVSWFKWIKFRQKTQNIH